MKKILLALTLIFVGFFASIQPSEAAQPDIQFEELKIKGNYFLMVIRTNLDIRRASAADLKKARTQLQSRLNHESCKLMLKNRKSGVTYTHVIIKDYAGRTMVASKTSLASCRKK